MNIKRVLEMQRALVRPDEEDYALFSSYVSKIVAGLAKTCHTLRLKTDVFVGGSFAKGTVLKKQPYDVDIFVRFDLSYTDLSSLLEKIVTKTCKELGLKFERVHGSRDYFQIKRLNDERFIFEVIPVLKIRRPQDEQNVTDLSYFHVAYMKKKARGLEDEIRLAKSFCYAQGVYGAESYIQGFSGHALECLIVHYRSFEKMLRELSKAKETVVIDLARHYAHKNDVLINLNASKLKSPIVLIDPTYKGRNALAALSDETFMRFQKAARAFLQKPGLSFFVEKKLDSENLAKKAKKRKAELAHVAIVTNRQEGDIAGTKLKKFHYFLENKIQEYFDLLEHHFVYGGGQKADIYLVLKSKKEIIMRGPPLNMIKHVRAFTRAHARTFNKKGRVYARVPIRFSGAEFIKRLASDKEKIVEMGITGLKIV